MVSQPGDELNISCGEDSSAQKAAIRFNLCVVEDDPAQLRILMQRLKDCCSGQIQLFGTSSPQEAMQRIEARSVDILITDLVMPYFSGVDLLRELKSRNTCTQALILTATADVDSLMTAFELGAVDYLLKPVVPEQIDKLVREAVERLSRWRIALAEAFRRTRRGLAVSTS